MTAQTKTVIKTYFETGDTPTEAQFIDLIDSYSDFDATLLAIATAAQGGQTGIIVIESTAQVTTRALGAGVIKFLEAATTAAARNALELGTLATANSITLSQMPNNPSGGVFVTNTAGSAANLSGGTTGQVLTSQGSATPVFAAVVSTVRATSYTSAGSHTWTKASTLVGILVRGVGGGGGGGGTNVSAGGAAGGGGGGYFERYIPAVTLGATETIVVGSGGAGKVGVGAGTAGGATTLGTLCSAAGGQGGGAATGGAGGGASGGDLNIQGSRGNGGQNLATGLGFGGGGGGSLLGGASGDVLTSVSSNGFAGLLYGGGGGGGVNLGNGGTGATGSVFIIEYHYA